MRISQALWKELVEHAAEEAPNECCGYVRNSPYGYELDAKSLFRVNELDDEGFEVGVYHSHPRSPAEPSQTDINLASYPHWTYLIVSLQNGDAPVVRGWRIADGRVEEEAIRVED